MNETIKSILERRSIRSFTDRKIERDLLEQIVQAGYYAPSGRNLQTWRFTVVQNKEVMERLAQAVRQALGRGEDYDFYRPDVLILTSNQRDNPLGMDDCACALENIFLAAHSLGIGSVWINQFKGICDQPAVREVLHSIGVLQDHLVYGCAALGYPADVPGCAVKNQEVVTWIL